MTFSIPTIESERLVLGPWSEALFDAFADAWANEDVARYIGGVKSRREAWRGFAAFIGHWHLRGYGMWALTTKTDGEFVGWSGPWNPETWPEPEIGWVLLPAAQGKGYATEAALRPRAFAYDTLGWTTAVSIIDARNAPSQRVAERCGARLERIYTGFGDEDGIWRHPSPADLAAAAVSS